MLKVKELKDNAIIQVPVSKGYYMMVKNAGYVLLNEMIKKNKSEDYLKEIGTKQYLELDDEQRTLHTLTLLIAEIEAQATAHNQFEEKEILQPGDEGYVAPTVD
jgi:hypothetical protein